VPPPDEPTPLPELPLAGEPETVLPDVGGTVVAPPAAPGVDVDAAVPGVLVLLTTAVEVAPGIGVSVGVAVGCPGTGVFVAVGGTEVLVGVPGVFVGTGVEVGPPLPQPVKVST
jgi:hypothetical protein